MGRKSLTSAGAGDAHRRGTRGLSGVDCQTLHTIAGENPGASSFRIHPSLHKHKHARVNTLPPAASCASASSWLPSGMPSHAPVLSLCVAMTSEITCISQVF